MKVFVEDMGYDYNLTFLDDDGQMETKLIFDVMHKVFIVRKSTLYQGSSELFLADNLTSFTK
ncbi:MAG: hypothetical protein QXW98_05165 [Candidatus Caldarchaeum sp.]